MKDDEILGGNRSSDGGRFFREPDDEPEEGNGCAGIMLGCIIVFIAIVVAAMVWVLTGVN